MKIKARISAPTPRFFKVLRNIGLVLGGIAGVVASAPVALPTAVISFAGYVAVAAGVLSAVSQSTVLVEPEAETHLLDQLKEQAPKLGDTKVEANASIEANVRLDELIKDSVAQTRTKGFRLSRLLNSKRN